MFNEHGQCHLASIFNQRNDVILANSSNDSVNTFFVNKPTGIILPWIDQNILNYFSDNICFEMIPDKDDSDNLDAYLNFNLKVNGENPISRILQKENRFKNSVNF